MFYFEEIDNFTSYSAKLQMACGAFSLQLNFMKLYFKCTGEECLK